MKKFFLCLWLCFLIPKTVLASDLGGSVIRLERSQSGQSPLPILVIIKTNTAVVEEALRITVGNGWTIDNGVAVSTVGLPSGVTPLPSISNGVKSSDRVIDFSIADLSPGVDYAFYITGGIGENPGAANYTWTMATLLGANVADSAKLSIGVVAADQVTIMGKVGASASDFQLEIGANKSNDLVVDEVVGYEINYGSYLLAPTIPLVVTASWSRGTVIGSPTPSVDVVDYVIGSGTTAFGGVSPVIDLVNRKITWTINSFPANTLNKKVFFQLKVNGSYTGQSRVKFDVEALLNGANVVTTDAKVTNYFRPSVLPTAAVTAVPDSSGVDSPTVTPTISTPIDFQITSVNIATLSDTKAGIMVFSNTAPSELKIKYGLSINNLNKSVTSINKLAIDSISIEDLEPETEYYFRIEAETSDGNLVNSDLYIFKTASSSEGSVVDKSTVMVVVGNNVFSGISETEEVINSAIMIPCEDYSFRINIKKSELVKSAQIYIRNSHILGINTVYGAEPNSVSVDLSEVANGQFVGHLASPKEVGYYDVILRIENINGLITEDRVGVLRVVSRFAVKDADLKGIENAKVTFYRYIPKKEIYELMSQESLGIRNPSFTESDGKLLLSLPKGKYRVEVSSIGFKEQQKDFVIGLGEEEKLPTIIMEKTKISAENWWNYYVGTTNDALNFSKEYLGNLMASTRFFKLVNIWILISSLIVFLRYYIEDNKIYWWSLPSYIWFSLKNLFKKKEANLTWGIVVDKESGLRIGGAKVYLLEAQVNKVIGTKITDNLGNFEFVVEPKKVYSLAATKDGYEAISLQDYTYQGLMIGNILMKMENILTKGEKVEIALSRMSDKVIWVAGIICLSILLGLELLFWQKMGFRHTWMWLGLLCLNIVGWLKR